MFLKDLFGIMHIVYISIEKKKKLINDQSLPEITVFRTLTFMFSWLLKSEDIKCYKSPNPCKSPRLTRLPPEGNELKDCRSGQFLCLNHDFLPKSILFFI